MQLKGKAIQGTTKALVMSILVISVAACDMAAQGEPPRPTGIFGRFDYHRASGDVTGIEVFVVYTRTGYMGVVQIAEGEPQVPVVVPIDLRGNGVSFTLPTSTEMLRFEGTIRQDGLAGRFSNGAFSDLDDGSVLLPRGNSYWQ